MQGFLQGKKGLIVGVANDQSIASGCAMVAKEQGARLALTYLSDKAKPHVDPVAEACEAELLMPLDVTDDAQMDAVFDRIKAEWGELDFLIHSIAFCPKQDLHGRVTDCSRDGFTQAMDISVHSFTRMARRAELLMRNGGSLLTVSYYGAEKVVDHYNVMGPVKAALESVSRYMAAELGPKGIRVNAISPGPLMTRAASGIEKFDALVDEAQTRAPLRRLVTIQEVGQVAACLLSPQGSAITGNVSYVDGGYHIMS
ncbi:enoyl-[acyl-carrier-protein] reductase FabI [Phaeobacter gallaeciensis]|uniref:Enoyl-[acyl-carrier-protein] reductase [NADH] n=1 Tax=Phaeobacter gallaeciensis TaxID=60890 RepID=A0A366X4I2_9RHOB|nr:enoyl-ACP reductase FabI [Phaeobacter gallaeciensis]RBW58561.1 enoyl-[acyl-carrier-protein] reductase FabI [Phaeobacter gallaeciensis]